VKTAYGKVNGMVSVYNDDWCLYPSAQIHEIGHNMGLLHSAEAHQEYGDKSCLMGHSFKDLETPKMCFNGAKSWILGWYEDGSVSVELSEHDQSWSGDLVGITDYNSTSNGYVIVEIVTGNADIDSKGLETTNNTYLIFNKKEGITSDVKDFENSLTLTMGRIRRSRYGKRGKAFPSSYLSDEKSSFRSLHLAHLIRGDSYTIQIIKVAKKT